MFYTPSNFKPNVGKARPVDTYSEIPESMDVYQRTEAQFLPDGKTLEELTPEELEWQNKHLLRTKKVKLNKLGLKRINKRRKEKRRHRRCLPEPKAH